MDKTLKLQIFLKKGRLRQEVWDKLDEAKTASDIAKEIVEINIFENLVKKYSCVN